MTVRVARLAFRRRAEHGRDVVVALDVSLGCEIQVTAVGLGFSRKCVFEIAFGLAAFQ